MGYEILWTVKFHIGSCNKFRDQSSVKGLSRQWVEFQKVRAWQILTRKACALIDDISTFSLTGKVQNVAQILMHWDARVSKRCKDSSWMDVNKEKLAQKLFYLSSTGNFTTKCYLRGISILLLTKISIGNQNNPNKEPYQKRVLVRFICEIECFLLKLWFTFG